MILSIRTDRPEAEIGLFEADGSKKSYHVWMAHRELSNTLLKTIQRQLISQNANFDDIRGVVVFTGPGSFTGLRIGITVANTLSYGLGVPIIGANGDQWLKDGLKKLSEKRDDKLVLPFYGAEANITRPKQ